MKDSPTVRHLVPTALVTSVLIAVLSLPVDQITSETRVHSKMDRLRLRSSVPNDLDEKNTLRYVSRKENFRKLREETGPSEKPGVTGRWVLVESEETHDQGWIAGWCAEQSASTPRILGTILFVMLLNRTDTFIIQTNSSPFFVFLGGVASIISLAMVLVHWALKKLAVWVGNKRRHGKNRPGGRNLGGGGESGEEPPVGKPCRSGRSNYPRALGAAADRLH